MFASACMVVMILDAPTVSAGARDGIGLCVSTVIPSLFPFFVISNFIRGGITGRNTPKLQLLGKFLGIPTGAEYAFLLGILGGYPIGAQTAKHLYASGSISKQDASRLLAFCNNAGPAFIFGMTASLFNSPVYAWSLWSIVIIAALITARLLTSEPSAVQNSSQFKPLTVTESMVTGLKAIANVCGWVIIFRTIITVLKHRVIQNTPDFICIAISGILELSNGIVGLHRIQNPALCFVICSMFLNFGGLCVCMQTHSAASGLDMRCYYIGKFLQTTVSILLSISVLPILFHYEYNTFLIICSLCSVFLITYTLFFKKRVAIFKNLVYNGRN